MEAVATRRLPPKQIQLRKMHSYEGSEDNQTIPDWILCTHKTGVESIRTAWVKQRSGFKLTRGVFCRPMRSMFETLFRTHEMITMNHVFCRWTRLESKAVKNIVARDTRPMTYNISNATRDPRPASEVGGVERKEINMNLGLSEAWRT